MTCKRTTISAGAHSLSKISLLYAVFQSYICSRVLPVSKCGKNLIFLIDFVLTLTYPVSLVFDQWTCAVLVSIVSWFLWNYSLTPNTIFMEQSFGEKLSNFLYIIKLVVNFENLIVRLHIPITSFMLVKFREDQNSIVMLSIKCLNFKFMWSKIVYKK